MSKFLVKNFIQKTSGYLKANHTLSAMSKRNNFRNTPRFKPEVKTLSNRPKQAARSMSPRREKVEVLPSPIKSDADKKIYK